MAHELAVIGIGDIRQKDQGISIYLLESLQKEFTDESVKFINVGADGEDLFKLLQQLVVKRVVILDVADTVMQPGRLNYLTIAPKQAEIIEELILIMIEPFKTNWGTKLSSPLIKKYNKILEEIKNIINQMLTGPLVKS